MRLRIDESLVRLVQSMYKIMRGRVRVGSGYSEEFDVKVGVHLGPVSSKCLRQDFVLENVLGRFKDKSRVSSNSRNLGSSQILS